MTRPCDECPDLAGDAVSIRIQGRSGLAGVERTHLSGRCARPARSSGTSCSRNPFSGQQGSSGFERRRDTKGSAPHIVTLVSFDFSHPPYRDIGKNRIAGARSSLAQRCRSPRTFPLFLSHASVDVAKVKSAERRMPERYGIELVTSGGVTRGHRLASREAVSSREKRGWRRLPGLVWPVATSGHRYREQGAVLCGAQSSR